MAAKSKDTLAVTPPPKSSSRSPSRSPGPKSRKKAVAASSSYASDGVTDNNIFHLPASDYRTLALVTIVAAVVRLFRIYQPSSVVFDEVQYVCMPFSAPAYAGDNLVLMHGRQLRRFCDKVH